MVETRRSHPDGLSHYNLLAGGFAGGASLGMNRQYWGYAVAPMLDRIAHDPAGLGAMYWHDVIHDALSMYKREGRLPPTAGDMTASYSNPRNLSASRPQTCEAIVAC